MSNNLQRLLAICDGYKDQTTDTAQEQTTEPRTPIVNTSVYFRSRGRMPRGHNTWLFMPIKDYHNGYDMENAIMFASSYAEAKRKAIKHFNGAPIYILPEDC